MSRRRAEQCSVNRFEVDPSTVEATPEEIRENVRALHENFDFWDELKAEVNYRKWQKFQADLRWYRENIRGGINLELALIISLLVLVAVMTLSLSGHGIANHYAEAAGFLTGGAVVEAPSNGAAEDNGDGSYTIRWDGGEAPFEIIRSTQPDMSSPEIIGSTPDRSYAVLPMPGENNYQIIDGDGRTLPAPVEIVRPLPPLPLVCGDPSAGLLTATTACVEIPPTNSGPRNPMVWITLADYAAPPAGWPEYQADPDTGELLYYDALCLRCHDGAALP
jgi:hypothetical protein